MSAINLITLKNLVDNLEFSYFELDDWVGIKTPYLLPDGDIIDIFLKGKDKDIILTDLGETIGWLLTQAISDEAIEQKITNSISFYQVERDRGVLFKRCKIKDVKSAINDLCQTILVITLEI